MNTCNNINTISYNLTGILNIISLNSRPRGALKYNFKELIKEKIYPLEEIILD